MARRQASLSAFFGAKTTEDEARKKRGREPDETKDKEPLAKRQKTKKDEEETMKASPSSFFGSSSPSSALQAASQSPQRKIKFLASPSKSGPAPVPTYSRDQRAQAASAGRKMADQLKILGDDADDDASAKSGDVDKKDLFVMSDFLDDEDDDDDDDFAEKKPFKISPKRPDPAKKETPKKPQKKAAAPKTPPTKTRGSGSSSSSSKSKEEKKEEKKEERYFWLIDIRDENKRPKSDPNYEKTTLFIPQEAYNNMTAFEQQYWDVKRKYFDTVVFFKKGKFYELYEFDADIGRKEFDLKVTDRVNMKMVGVPEQSFSTWASRFLAHGHRITVVDHSESKLSQQRRNEEFASPKSNPLTPRSKKGKSETDKKAKIIQRDVTKVLTPATITDEDMILDFTANYVVSIKEVPVAPDSPAVSISICIVDCTIGKFMICNWIEDSQSPFEHSHGPTQLSPLELFATQSKQRRVGAKRSVLKRLLLLLRPKEILVEKDVLSFESLMTIRDCLGDSTAIQTLKKTVQFPTHEKSLEYIQQYWGSETEKWPSILFDLHRQKAESEIFDAIGAVLYYLQYLKIDKEVVLHSNFDFYSPLQSQQTHLIMDGPSLMNLEIFQNNEDGSSTNTLFGLLNQCITPSGVRKIRQWISQPLFDIISINDRLDAIEELCAHPDLTGNISSSFKILPDVERQIRRLVSTCFSEKSMVISSYSTSPSQLILFRLFTALQSLKHIQGVMKQFLVDDPEGKKKKKKCFLKSRLINQIVEQFPFDLLENELNHFRLVLPPSLNDLMSKPMSAEKATISQDMMIEDNDDPEYIEAKADLDKVFELVEAYRLKICEELGLTSRERDQVKITSKAAKRDLFHLEVSTALLSKHKAPSHWEFVNDTKDIVRYHTEELDTFGRMIPPAEERLEIVRQSILSKNLHRFVRHHAEWYRAIDSVATVDCLLSLMKVSQFYGGSTCRPQFVESEGPVFEAVDMRHPIIAEKASDSFISNTIRLGDQGSVVVLTGPNMGGKSTLLRQTCLLVIMCQIGCYVPASECRLSLFDRIFTRIGARDDIFSGCSTLMVELQETSSILQFATRKSLIVMDELGRGTSTFDGYSIAFAVLRYLIDQVQCMALFSTHYHMLTDEVRSANGVSLQHMASQFDHESNQLVFLYQLREGVCPRSYGMNAAKLAGIPESIVTRAFEIATAFEKKTREHERHQMVQKLGSKLVKEWMTTGKCESVLERLKTQQKAIREGLVSLEAKEESNSSQSLSPDIF